MRRPTNRVAVGVALLLGTQGCKSPGEDGDDTVEASGSGASSAASASSSVAMAAGTGGADTGAGGGDTGGGSSVSASSGWMPQCTLDEDCAYLDVDGDECTKAVCARGGKCHEELVVGTVECQCHVPADCAYYQQICNVVSCGDGHQCTIEIWPAGPAPAAYQVAGDCNTVVCDGVHDDWLDAVFDAGDLDDDGNDCTVDACTTSGTTHEPLGDGSACTGGFCFLGGCMPCVPADPAACGGEGASEPLDDEGTTATPYARYSSVCGFLDTTDVDWFEYWADDSSWTYDILAFDVRSTAPELQLCAFVACWNGGAPLGGCVDKIPGPNGSQGCCWSGPPETLQPTWDLYCEGTSEDSGTVYVAVSAPLGDSCDTYALYSHY